MTLYKVTKIIKSFKLIEANNEEDAVAQAEQITYHLWREESSAYNCKEKAVKK